MNAVTLRSGMIAVAVALSSVAISPTAEAAGSNMPWEQPLTARLLSGLGRARVPVSSRGRPNPLLRYSPTGRTAGTMIFKPRGESQPQIRQGPRWVIRDRGRVSSKSGYFRSAPKATELLRRHETT